MKSILRISCVVVLLLGFTSLASAATWTGRISDSGCGASHAKMQAQHGGAAKFSAHDCAVACVKGGAQYVFVTGGKVYKIANQDFADLDTDAGRTLRLTGDLSGDTITVSKLALPAPKKAS